MTDPSEVKISDAEARQLRSAWANAFMESGNDMGATKQALAAFLAARVPGAKVRTGERLSRHDQMGAFVLDEQARAVNEFRDAVLKGGV
jgi:hypothetical protein